LSGLVPRLGERGGTLGGRQEMDKDNEGNSTDKIEITPEMIEAGKNVISSNWSTFLHEPERFGEIVSLVYRAMYEHHLKYRLRA
jgi:hypothetical protein